MNFNKQTVTAKPILIASMTAVLLHPLVPAESGGNTVCSIRVINKFNEEVPLIVEIAVTPDKRRTGLMYRKKMPRDHGMLFVFTEDTPLVFWMKNTYIPLSIAYIDKNGYINDIHHMEPLNATKTYPSKKPSRYALEVNMGWFHENNIKPGCRILLHGCFGKQDTPVKR